MPARKPAVILIRHSLPQMDENIPASQWHLSGEGRRRCTSLAERLEIYHPQILLSSTEIKAIETAQIVAKRLGLPCTTATGLHEQERSRERPGTQEEFQARLRVFFERPDQLVFGDETADQAHERFSRAVTGLLEQDPHPLLAIVSHGTVITLFVSRLCRIDPFPFWQSLGLPGFVVLSSAPGRLEETCQVHAKVDIGNPLL
jgi:broad specificity phosphatase PhoE